MIEKVLTEQEVLFKVSIGSPKTRVYRMVRYIFDNQDLLNEVGRGSLLFDFKDSNLTVKLEEFENVP